MPPPIPFRRRPPQRQPITPLFVVQVASAALILFAVTLIAMNWPSGARPTALFSSDAERFSDDAERGAAGDRWSGDTGGTSTRHAVRFGRCHAGGGQNCVVDGDTLWAAGEKIRIASIDTPETHPPRCPAEAQRGAAATRRLQAWLNDGPFELVDNPGRSHDRYGRRLAVPVRDGESVGAVLIAEGLARRYDGGPRAGWC